MFNRRLRLELSYPYLILIFLALLIFGFYSTNVFEKFYLSVAEDNLRSKAFILQQELLTDSLISYNKIDTAKIKSIIAEFDKLSDTRITLILPSGKVINDSREDPALMDNHFDRPEVQDALKKEAGYSIRYSHTLHTDFMYCAISVSVGNNIIAFLRTAVSLEHVENALQKKFINITLGGFVILLVAVLLGYFISKKLSSPLLEMKSAAERFSAGNLEHKIYPPNIIELKELAESLNSMARQLNEKLNIISEQKNIQQAVLESMKEGVIAADYNEKILLVNKTAEGILSLSDTKDRTLQEAIRVAEIQSFFSKVFKESSPQETEINVQNKTLQLRGTPLYDAEKNRIGVLVVINDITGLKYLDSLKRDFVANVSHELKTPITAIKGFIETLKEGAVKEPENAQRFLEIVSRHAERLNLIIEDLLSLSRLEQKAAVKEMKFLREKIKPVLESVIDDFEFKAAEKHLSIKLECNDDLTANINRPLIEEAVGNLIDNAIKYNDKKGEIKVKAAQLNGRLIISVSDQGTGISEEHLPRIFERFYRVDKARSREAGGTGLGLAIVKHIAQVHNGTAEAHSKLGKGSTFIIVIPS